MKTVREVLAELGLKYTYDEENDTTNSSIQLKNGEVIKLVFENDLTLLGTETEKENCFGFPTDVYFGDLNEVKEFLSILLEEETYTYNITIKMTFKTTNKDELESNLNNHFMDLLYEVDESTFGQSSIGFGASRCVSELKLDSHEPSSKPIDGDRREEHDGRMTRTKSGRILYLNHDY